MSDTPPTSSDPAVTSQPAAEAAAPPGSATPPRRFILYLVRHGQTQYNVEQRLPGQLPGIVLNEAGARQAEELAGALRELPLTAVVASPLDRARQTAEMVIRDRDVPLRFDARLMDTDVGRWAGRVIRELAAEDPDWNRFVHRPTAPPAGIEGFYAVTERVVAAAEAARHDASLGDAVMLVAHADVIRLIVTHYLRLPIEGAGWLHIPNASVTTLTFEGEREPTLVALNWTPSPAWLRPPPPVAPAPPSTEMRAGTLNIMK